MLEQQVRCSGWHRGLIGPVYAGLDLGHVRGNQPVGHNGVHRRRKAGGVEPEQLDLLTEERQPLRRVGLANVPCNVNNNNNNNDNNDTNTNTTNTNNTNNTNTTNNNTNKPNTNKINTKKKKKKTRGEGTSSRC